MTALGPTTTTDDVLQGVDLERRIADDPNYETRPYDKWEAYGQSKTANILFALELDGRLSKAGGHAFSVHPGMIATNLARHLDRGDFKDLMERGRSRNPERSSARIPMKSVESGAATSVSLD